jgi:TonB-dependent starch-binding outer membrane protein SusC
MKKKLDYSGLFKPKSNWHKLFMIMKISAFLLFCCLVNIFAGPTYSQSTKISLNLKDATIEEVLNKIEDVSEFYFLFNQKLIDVNQKVNIEAENEPIKDILNDLLKKEGVNFVVYDRQIILTPSDVSSLSAAIQQLKIAGTVTDENGKPMPGTTVQIEGTSIGVLTDANGKYSIDIKNINSVLVFSFVGYDIQKVTANGRTTIDLQMVPNLKQLEEVVVVGYGTQRKRDVTGATSSIKADVIAIRPITRVDQALQGTTPGVSVTSNSGQPGKAVSVRIRGINSITGSNDPLYVIDGYVGGNIDAVTPDDIESIEVLKDASSTAIYGSRGSNGVVMITTKRGSEGKLKVDFSAWGSAASMPRYLSLMDAYDFATVKNEMKPGSFTDAQLTSFQTNPGTDWQKAVTRTAYVQNYQLTLSGGTADVKYLVSGGYLDQPGIMINSDYKRADMRINLDVKASDKLDFKFNVIGYQGTSHNNNYSGDLYDPLALAVTWDPTSPIKDANGVYIYHSAFGNDQINPVAQARNQASDGIMNDYTTTGMLNYKIIKGLTFTSTASIQSQFQRNPSVFNKYTAAGFGNSDNATVVDNRNVVFQNSNYFTYNNTFGDHAITLTALYEQQSYQHTGVTARSNNLSSYNNGYYNLGLGAAQITTSEYTADQLQSYMGRINYSYKEKYLLTASVRDDGSSHLTTKYSVFPSVALGWVISKENFLKDSQAISNLKIRGSWGKTGNQSVGAYSTIPGIGVNSPYAYISGAIVSTPLQSAVAQNLKWETTAQYDAGLDAAFLKGRLTFTVDWYSKKVSDLLYNVNNDVYYGGGNHAANVGSLSNKGLEFTLGGTPVSGDVVRWNTYLTLSFNTNKILDLGGNDNIQINGIGQQQTGLSLLKVGEPLGEFYGYTFIGTWKTSEAAQAAAYGCKPGDAKFLDIDNSGKYDAGDVGPIGNALPKYTFGFTNDISYSNFSLSFMFQGMKGNKISSTLFPSMYGNSGDARDATSVDVLNMWTAANETDFPVVSSGSNRINSSRYVFDASFVKLKNISLTYTLPKRIIKGISKLEIYVSGQNVFCITPYKGFDPETTTAAATGASAQGVSIQGLETGSVPNPRSYTIGIRASF